MYQLELVFRLLVRLQLMYLQYNVYLSIVVRTYIYIYIYTHVIQNNLRTPQLAGFARQLGCKNTCLCNCEVETSYLCTEEDKERCEVFKFDSYCSCYRKQFLNEFQQGCYSGCVYNGFQFIACWWESLSKPIVKHFFSLNQPFLSEYQCLSQHIYRTYQSIIQGLMFDDPRIYC